MKNYTIKKRFVIGSLSSGVVNVGLVPTFLNKHFNSQKEALAHIKKCDDNWSSAHADIDYVIMPVYFYRKNKK